MKTSRIWSIRATASGCVNASIAWYLGRMGTKGVLIASVLHAGAIQVTWTRSVTVRTLVSVMSVGGVGKSTIRVCCRGKLSRLDMRRMKGVFSRLVALVTAQWTNVWRETVCGAAGAAFVGRHGAKSCRLKRI